MKVNIVNSQQHGPWKWHWDSGKLEIKGNYLNGKRHGLWEEHRSNGELIEIEYYIT
jgi:antitoxin component YwqK of YwqJK toxin-antitoxin module